MLHHFCTAVAENDADIMAGVMAASVFRARYPHSKRSFIPLREESFCGTNLFALCTPQAAPRRNSGGMRDSFANVRGD